MMILIEQLALSEGLLYARCCASYLSFNPNKDPYIASNIIIPML